MTPDLGSNRTPPLPSGEAKSTWVYIKSEPSLWTVGFYRPDGSWEAESDHSSTEQAVERIGYLNGRNDSERLRAQNRDLLAALERLTSSNEDYAFSDEGDYMCAYCNRFLAGQDQHYPDCPILQARAAIAAAEETHD